MKICRNGVKAEEVKTDEIDFRGVKCRFILESEKGIKEKESVW